VPQDRDVAALRAFLDGRAKRPTLGLMYGRRRIGKSTLLVEQADQRGGFYFEATRVETPVHLERLGGALGEHLGVGRIELRSWDETLTQLLRLGGEQAIPVVLDEFGYLLEADPSLPSVIASTFGPGSRGSSGRAHMVLCGSAIAMMRSLTAGEAALRGRAGLELVMLPDDYRVPRPGYLTRPTWSSRYGCSRSSHRRRRWLRDRHGRLRPARGCR
jgi:uncharacterized protein